MSEYPIHKSGIETIEVAGVPRKTALWNITIWLFVIIGLQYYWLFFGPFICHLILALLYAIDFQFFTVLKRYFKISDYLEP